MNLRQIREECWDIARELNTNDADRLWSLKEMNRYINRVYREIARECRCITDSTTVEVCQIAADPVDWTTYTPGTLDYQWANDPESWLYQQNVCPYLYELHPSIIEVEEVKWVKRAWRLMHVSVTKWQENTYWEQSMGEPIEFATDLQTGFLAVNYRSQESDTLRLWVKRLPLVDLEEDDDSPEFKTHYHDFFKHGVLHHMYSKQDAQAFDGAKAGDYLRRFRQDIDEIKQSESEIERRLRPNHSMLGFR